MENVGTCIAVCKGKRCKKWNETVLKIVNRLYNL